jgi:glycosyltransferase involved in cell wall biosynthesis
MSTVLYITYDGLLDPLGMSQVWQYQKLLSKKHKIIILSYEKPHALRNKKNARNLDEEILSSGVLWHKLQYHKSPSLIATVYDIVHGVIVTLKLIKKHKIDFIHSRSYVSSTVAFLVNKITGIDYIFDMRGFWADEKVDGRVWKKASFLYKAVKFIECKILLNASSIVTLTKVGKSDVNSLQCMNEVNSTIQVIPTCANLKIFKPSFAHEESNSNDSNNFLLGYVGSVGTFYLFDQVLKSFKTLRKYKKNARLIILNKGQHEYINSMLISSNINPRDVEIKEADYNEVAKEINKMDAGIFYIKPSFSKRSSSPTKLAEFLGCGKPCLTNFGVGDTESVIYDENVGIVLQDFSENEHIRGIIGLLELLSEAGLKERCVSAAHKHYSLEDGVASYDSMYSMLKGSLD